MLILNKDGKPMGIRPVTILRDVMLCGGSDEKGREVILLVKPAKKQDIVEGA